MSNELGMEAQSRIEGEKGMQLSKEMQDFVAQKLGIKMEEIKDAIMDPSFAGDLQNLINNPENQTEKMLFLGKYIYEKIIAEAKKQGKDPIDFAIEQGKTEDFSMKLEVYIRNEKILKIEGKKQAAIEDIKVLATVETTLEKLNAIEKNIKEHIEKARGALNQEGNAKLNEGIQQYKQDNKFIKELEGKGYKQEDIKSGKFDETIAGYYIARNTDKIAPFITDQSKFESATKNIADALGEPRSFIPIKEKILDTFPDDARRGQILNTSTALLDSGKYTPELTTYNSSTGKITFRSKYSDDMTQIDTSKVPPVLEYSRGGLKIGREIAPVTPEDSEYRANKEQSDKNNKLIKSGEQEYAGIKNDLLSQQSIKYFQEQNKDDTSIISLFDQKSVLEKEYTEATSSSAKSEILAKLISSNSDINTKRIQSIKMPNIGTDLMRDTFEGVLEKEGLTLKTLKKQVDIQVELDKKLAKGDNKKPEGNIDQVFEKDSKATLGYLNYIGYNELGQDTLDRVISAINAKNQGSISEIDLSKNPKLDSSQEKELLRALAQLSRKSGIMESWQGVDSSDEIIAARQMSSPNWRTSLQDIGKGVKFQSMKSASTDAFMSYLYEKPQTETTKVEKPGEIQS